MSDESSSDENSNSEQKHEEIKLEKKSTRYGKSGSVTYKPSCIPKLRFVTPTQHFRVIQLFKRFDPRCTGFISFRDALKFTEKVLKLDFRSESMISLMANLETMAKKGNKKIEISSYFKIVNEVQLQVLSNLAQKEVKLHKQRKKLNMDQDELVDAEEDTDLRFFNKLGCCGRFCFDLSQKLKKYKSSQHYGFIWARKFAQIEARFGGSIVTYFMFAQYIFMLNLINSLIFLPILIPGMMAPNDLVAADYMGIVLGTGMEKSWMFYGYYKPRYWEGSYRMDIIWIACLIVMLLVALIAVLRSMDQRFDLHTEDQKKLKFSNLVFCQFDHNLMSKPAINLRRVALEKQLSNLVEEQVAESKKEKKMQDSPATLFFLRGLGWSLALIFGLGSTIAVGFLIYNEQELGGQALQYRYLKLFPGLVVPVSITTLKILNPLINRAIIKIEAYEDSKDQFRVMFFRIFVIKMFYVLVVMFNSVIKRSSEGENTACKETEVGLIYYRLLVVDLCLQFFLSVIMPFLILRMKQCCCPKMFSGEAVSQNNDEKSNDLEKEDSKNREKEYAFLKHYLPELDQYKKEFKIPENILNIMYFQALVWSGTPYCPFLPILAVVYSFCLVLLKLFQVRHWSKPYARPMGVAEQKHYFRGLMIVTLGVCVLPFSLFLKTEMTNCGPHKIANCEELITCKNPSKIFFDWINTAPNFISLAFQFLQSSLVLWVILILIMIYALFSRKREFMLHKELLILRKRLKIEINEKAQILRDNGIILGTNIDKDRGKKMFNTWMNELGDFGRVFSVKFQEAYFGDVLELVLLKNEELITIMEGFGDKGIKIPTAHIIFFLRQLERKRIELIS